MELVSTLTLGGDEAGGFEHVEMLRNALARDADLVLHGEARAQLKQRLAVALDELVENGAPDGRHDRFEDIAHGLDNRQVKTCLSSVNLCLLPHGVHHYSGFETFYVVDGEEYLEMPTHAYPMKKETCWFFPRGVIIQMVVTG